MATTNFFLPVPRRHSLPPGRTSVGRRRNEIGRSNIGPLVGLVVEWSDVGCDAQEKDDDGQCIPGLGGELWGGSCAWRR